MIKSDRWIRRMAAAHRIIDPFEPGQVREVDGRPIVSYGTSSYGYDIRCSREFKIFTNINSTIVDPKKFDAGSFVDFIGDVCIIPPNSFALARTVEYFRIPRNVLTICLGKCVTGDTRVVDADTGAFLPISAMGAGGNTVALNGWRADPARVTAMIPQGRKPVFELRTRAGLRIRATAKHPFRQLHGWTPLDELKIGDRIAAARNVPVFGRRPLPDWEASLLGLMISEGQCRTPGHSPTFTSSDPVLVALLERSVAAGGLGTVTAKAGPWVPTGQSCESRRCSGIQSGVALASGARSRRHGRGKIRAAGGIHVAEGIDSAVPASVVLGGWRCLPLRRQLLRRVLLEVPPPDRGRASSAAAVRRVLAHSRQDNCDRNAGA